MSDDQPDDEADEAPSPNQQWATIFSHLGKARLRQFLFHATSKLAGEEQDRVVYEMEQTDDGVAVFNITEHVDELESDDDQPLPSDLTPDQ